MVRKALQVRALLCLLLFAGVHLSALSAGYPPDTYRYNVGILTNFSSAVSLSGEYALKDHLSANAALGGFHTHADYILNSQWNTISGLYGKGGIALKALSAKKGYQSWTFPLNLVVSYVRHQSLVEIPYAYGVYRAPFHQDFVAVGLQYGYSKYIRFSPRLYMELGANMGVFSIKHGLPADSFVPGGGAVFTTNDQYHGFVGTIEGHAGLRYRFNLSAD